MVDKSLEKWVEHHIRHGYDAKLLREMMHKAGYPLHIIESVLPHKALAVQFEDIKKKEHLTKLPAFIRQMRGVEKFYNENKAWESRYLFLGLSLVISICCFLGIILYVKDAYRFMAPIKDLAIVLAPLGDGLARSLAAFYAFNIPLMILLCAFIFLIEIGWIKWIGWITAHFIETLVSDIPVEAIKHSFKASQIITLLFSIFGIIIAYVFSMFGKPPSLLSFYLFTTAHFFQIFFFGVEIHYRSAANHRKFIWVLIILLTIILVLIGSVSKIFIFTMPWSDLAIQFGGILS